MQEAIGPVRSLVQAALFLVFLAKAAAAQSPEPAYFGGQPAVRLEEAVGVYHYTIPCGQAPNGGLIFNTGTGTPSALCWPVRVQPLQDAGGKNFSLPPVDGMLRVSPMELQFVPYAPKDAGSRFSAHAAQMILDHTAGREYGEIYIGDLGYRFTFSNLCTACKGGSPVTLDVGRGAQREQEYTVLRSAISQFATIAQQVQEVARNVRVGVRPSNQPAVGRDPPEAMELYAQLNQKLAETCFREAKTCVQSYEMYQRCTAGGGKQCGDLPACSASCVVRPEMPAEWKAGLCVTPLEDSATLIPQWTDALTRIVAERQKDPASHPWAATMNTNPDRCGVLFRYGAAQLSYNQQKVGITNGSVVGVAGMSQIGAPGGVPGGVMGSIGSVPTAGKVLPPGGPVQVSGGVMAGNVINRITPVYPAVAKAAHVSGSVVMYGVISKKGEVAQLNIISGPELLRTSAMEAVRQWKYQPYLINGVPTEVNTTITVNFGFGSPAQPAPTNLPK